MNGLARPPADVGGATVSTSAAALDPKISTLIRLLIAVVLGFGLGVTNSLCNALGSPYSPASLSVDGIFPMQVLAAALGTTWAWSFTGFVAGVIARRVWVGPLAGMLSLVVADFAYYGADKFSGYAGGMDVTEVLYWAALAVPCGLGMGLFGALAAQPHRWSLLPGLAAPVTILVLLQPSGTPDLQPWPTVLAQTTAAVTTLVVLVAWVIRFIINPSPRGAIPAGSPAGH